MGGKSAQIHVRVPQQARWCNLLVLVMWIAGSLAAAAPGLRGSVVQATVAEKWRGVVRLTSWEPKIYHLKGFLSDEECEHLKKYGSPRRTNGLGVDLIASRWLRRTLGGQGAPVSGASDGILSEIEQRLAEVSMLPQRHQENMEVLRFVEGEGFAPHYDYYSHDLMTSESFGGQRIITVLMYLSVPEEGGEIVFPQSDKRVLGPGWSKCVEKGFGFKPRKGDGIMLYTLHPDGSKDEKSLYGICPTLEGETWMAIKRIREGPRLKK